MRIGHERTAAEAVGLNEVCDLIVPPYWSELRPDQTDQPHLGVISHDTVQGVDSPNSTFVFREEEIAPMNVLLAHEDDWLISSHGRKLVAGMGNPCFWANPGDDFNSRFGYDDVFDTLVRDLAAEGLIEFRRGDVAGGLSNQVLRGAGVEMPTELEWRVNQNLRLTDVREEFQRAGFEYHLPVAHTVLEAQVGLEQKGYVLISDEAFGVQGSLTHELTDIFNTPGMVVRAERDHPPNRERARYVIDAQYSSNPARDGRLQRVFPEFGLSLQESDEMRVVSNARTDITNRPEYSRVPLLERYPAHTRYVAGLLAVAAKFRPQDFARAGVNEFRTFDIATEGGHSDFGLEEEALVAIRVNWRDCQGGRTHLLPPYNGPVQPLSPRPLVSVELKPGGVRGVTLMFLDYKGQHRVTNLVRRPGSTRAVREATVITIQWRKPIPDVMLALDMARHDRKVGG
jgi:hypothetical protein